MIREADMTPIVADYLRHTGLTIIQEELSFFQCSIDIYAASADGANTVAVELKLENWRKAVRQARVYQLCADRVFLAMPSVYVHRVDIDSLSCIGLGVLSVDMRPGRPAKDGVVQLLEAAASPIQQRRYTQRIVSSLEAINHA